MGSSAPFIVDWLMEGTVGHEDRGRVAGGLQWWSRRVAGVLTGGKWVFTDMGRKPEGSPVARGSVVPVGPEPGGG
jgi:hypothetical protein